MQFTDWLNGAIYAAIGFLLLFAFNKMDNALQQLSEMKTDYQLMQKDLENLQDDYDKLLNRVDENDLNIELLYRQR